MTSDAWCCITYTAMRHDVHKVPLLGMVAMRRIADGTVLW
jgi:hypothetical protein